jgi:hypothetical protein
MSKQYGDYLPIAGTIQILIPESVLKFDKGDKLKKVNTLTKGGNISGGKIKNIVLIPVKELEARVSNKGSVRPATKKAIKEQSKYFEDEVNKKIQKSTTLLKSTRQRPSDTIILNMSNRPMPNANIQTFRDKYPTQTGYNFKMKVRKQKATRKTK